MNQAFTDAELQAARTYCALADSAFDADFGFADHVTDDDRQTYANDQRRYAGEVLRGEHDTNFSVRQNMWYFLTGECVPLLAPNTTDKQDTKS